MYLCELKDGLKRSRYYTQRYLTLWKIIVFMVVILISLKLQDDDPLTFFTRANEAFGDRLYTVHEVRTFKY